MKVIEDAMQFHLEYPRITTQEPDFMDAQRKTIVTNENSKPGQQILTINHENGNKKILDDAMSKALVANGSQHSQIVVSKHSVRQSQR